MIREVGFVGYGEDLGNYSIPVPAFKSRMERFAELIVNECAGVADKTVIGTDKVGKAIKQHFGINQTKQEKFDQAMQEAFANGVDLSGRETP